MRYSLPPIPPIIFGQPPESYLSLAPPIGWRGGECPAGQVVADTESLLVVVDRMRAFTEGFLLDVLFFTPDTELGRRLRGRGDSATLAQRVQELPTDAGGSVSVAGAQPLDHAAFHSEAIEGMGLWSDDDVRIPLFIRAALLAKRQQLPPGPVALADYPSGHGSSGIVVHLWVRPWPRVDALSLAFTPGSTGTTAGKVTLDLSHAREYVQHSRQLFSVD